MDRERMASSQCPECADPTMTTTTSASTTPTSTSRRDFLRRVGAASAGLVLANGLVGTAGIRNSARAMGPSPTGAAETAAKRLFQTLDAKQKSVICFPIDHQLRKKINANWAITPSTIGKDFTKEQQALITDIVKGVTSPEGYDKLKIQMEDDAGGIGAYHVAFFGEPDAKNGFEFELTGRHVTLRADGDTLPNLAFGGPLIYGHGEGDGEKGLPGNVYYPQTQKANEVFKALDGGQRDKALIAKAPQENAVALQGKNGKFPGISVGDLSSDQKGLVAKVMRDILSPYRKEDAEEVMALIEDAGGLDQVHFAFYRTDDLGNDNEWDIWRLEGPNMVWHFRGAPHVHAYINVAKTAKA